MAYIIYFSSEIEPNGEIKLIRRDEEMTLNPVPPRVDIVVHDAPIHTNADPTLSIFYEPDEEKRDA